MLGKLHSDKRGFFQELLRVAVPFHQVSWFSIEPGQERGHHYHLHTRECFVCMEGAATAILGDANHENYLTVELKQGDVLETKPPEPHAFYSKNGAKLLALSSQHFDPDCPDTYSSQITKAAVEHIKTTI